MQKLEKEIKKMKNKIKFGLLLLAVAALVLVPGASAYTTYVPSVASSCGVCHVNPNGGGTLTPAGTTFKNTGKLPVVAPPVKTPPVVAPPVKTPPVIDDDHHKELKKVEHESAKELKKVEHESAKELKKVEHESAKELKKVEHESEEEHDED